MRAKHFSILLGVALLSGLTVSYTLEDNSERSYTPQNYVQEIYSTDGYLQWLHRIKANQETNTISPEDIRKAEAGLQTLAKSGNHESFNWIEKGPNNIGGRSRVVLIDKNNPSIYWAGSIGGGIWKSTTAGQYWEKVEYSVPDGYTPTTVTTITQAANGKIYFGTGEAFMPNFTNNPGNSSFLAHNQGVPLMRGGGIFVQHENTFRRLASTAPANSSDFYGVRRLVAHPTNANNLMAATTTGLWETTDGGETWTKTISETGQSWDVAVSSAGDFIANVGKKTYLRKNGQTEWTVVSGSLENGKIPELDGRYVYDFLDSNPNYVFASIASAAGDLEGVYRSLNGGESWIKVGFGGNAEFNVFGTLKVGVYSHALRAIGTNTILLGGIDIWRGSSTVGQTAMEWNKISYWSAPETSSSYIHANIHWIEPLPNGNGFLAATDGGIFRRDNNGTRPINTYFNITQLYNADINSKGEILAASQSNGILLMRYNLSGSQNQSAQRLFGGDGLNCLFSRLSPNLMIFSSDSARIQKSNDYAENLQYFWDYRINQIEGWDATKLSWKPNAAPRLVPMSTWETDDYSNVRVDTSKVMALRPYDSATWYWIESANISGQKIRFYTGNRKYDIGDTLIFPDPYQATLLIGLANKMWFTRKPFNFLVPMSKNEWWEIAAKGVIGATSPRFIAVKFSDDGDVAYGATEPDAQGWAYIYRVSNLHAAEKASHACVFAKFGTDPTQRRTQIKEIGKIQNRLITSLETDPKNPEVLILTLGQYGNNNYIYVGYNARTTNSESFEDNFIPIQGNLPPMPVYTACVNKNPSISGQLLIGTEYGVFVMDNYLAAKEGKTVTWQEGNSGLGHYPVLNIRQFYVERRQEVTYKNGTYILATHGRGVFIDTAHVWTSIGSNNNNNPIANLTSFELKLYPNPVLNDGTIQLLVTERTNIDIQIFDLSGKMIQQLNTGTIEAGTHNIALPVAQLKSGTYLIQCINGKERKTVKMLKR